MTVDYIPLNVQISSLTIGNPTSVTTSSAHYFVVGQLIRFHIAKPYGTRQLNQQLTYVTSIPTTTSFEADVDSSKFDPFIASPTYPGNTLPQVSAVGDQNNTSQGLTISGAFYNNT